MIRIEKIAKSLYNDSILRCAKASKMFNNVVSQFSSSNGVKVIKKRPHKGVFEVNGYMKEIKKCVSKCRKAVPDCIVVVTKPDSREKMRYMIEIKPNLNGLPERAKAKFNGDTATFTDGVYKGEEVVWSSRIPDEDIPSLDSCNDDLLIIVPDMHRSTFYGWKRRS